MQTGLLHNLTTMQISEWVELIKLLHIETFGTVVAEMRERYQENDRHSSPVLIIFNTLQVTPTPVASGSGLRGGLACPDWCNARGMYGIVF